jgi:hypothetical protein
MLKYPTEISQVKNELLKLEFLQTVIHNKSTNSSTESTTPPRSSGVTLVY